MSTTRKGKLGSFLLLICIIIGYLLINDKSKPEEKLYGIWKVGEHDIQFNDNHTFEIKINGAVYDYGDYSVDFNQNPAYINIMSRKSYHNAINNGNDYFFAGIPTLPVARGIIRFVTNDEIDFAFSTKLTAAFGSSGVYDTRIILDQRPPSFEYSGETTLNTLHRSSNSIGWVPVSFRTSKSTILVKLTRVLK